MIILGKYFCGIFRLGSKLLMRNSWTQCKILTSEGGLGRCLSKRKNQGLMWMRNGCLWLWNYRYRARSFSSCWLLFSGSGSFLWGVTATLSNRIILLTFFRCQRPACRIFNITKSSNTESWMEITATSSISEPLVLWTPFLTFTYFKEWNQEFLMLKHW